MYRLALAALAVALAIALIALLFRSAMRKVDAETSRPVNANGGAMQKIAFFLLLWVMAYAITTGAS